jgi:hypothetical protein
MRGVTVKRDGKTFSGHYEVAGGTITVTYGFYSRWDTQLGRRPAEVLARLILHDLVSAELADKERYL